MMKRFALVVGASGAIGRAISEKLAADGWSLYLHYNSGTTAAASLCSALQSDYPNQEFMTVQADFLQQTGADELARQIFSLQSIVFASGQAHYSLLEDTSTVAMDDLWRVHVQNPMRLVALLSAKLRANQVSYILFIGSIWGEAGAAGEVVYSAVKGAQHAFVKAYAREAAPSGIRVNAIAPGFIETSMNGHLSADEVDDLLQDIPLVQAGQTQDVAEMVGFYVSGKADYVTGQIVRLNGGWYI